MEATASRCKSGRIRELHRKVCRIKSSEEIGVKFMQAWEEKAYARMEGKAEGKAEVKANEIRLIRHKLEKSMTVAEIADLLEQDETETRRIAALLREHPDEPDMGIAMRYYGSMPQMVQK